MRVRMTLIAIASLAVVLPSLGCAVGGGTRFSPESHFVFPNSNVKALGPVRVKVKSPPTLFVPPPVRTAETDKQLYDMAMRQQQGADLLIDYVVTTKITLLPIPYVSVYLTEHELEGTAAKMVIGKQRLR